MLKVDLVVLEHKIIMKLVVINGMLLVEMVVMRMDNMITQVALIV